MREDQRFPAQLKSKFEHFVSFSEMRRHSLTGLSCRNNSTCAGKLWSWRIQRRAKRRRLAFWSWSHRVWNSRVDKMKCFLSTFLVISNSISGQPRHFNRDEIGRIRSDFDAWPAIRCARIRGFQRSSTQRNATLLKVCEAIFLKMGAKQVHKPPEYGLYSSERWKKSFGR